MRKHPKKRLEPISMVLVSHIRSCQMLADCALPGVKSKRRSRQGVYGKLRLIFQKCQAFYLSSRQTQHPPDEAHRVAQPHPSCKEHKRRTEIYSTLGPIARRLADDARKQRSLWRLYDVINVVQ